MRATGFWIALFFLLALTPARAAGLEVYGRLPTVEDFSISPDGKTIAYATDVGGKRVVLVRSLEDGKTLGALAVGDQKLRDLSWADNTRLLMLVSSAKRPQGDFWAVKRELYLGQAYDITTHKQIPMLKNIEHALNVVFDDPQPRTVNGHLVLFVTGITFDSETGHGRPTLFSIDLDASRTKLLLTGDDNTEGWVIDEAGNPAAMYAYNDLRKLWSLHLRQGSDWKQIYETSAPIERPSVLGIGPDGQSVLVTMMKDGANVGMKFSLADGTPSAMPELNGGSPAGPIIDKVTHRVIGFRRMRVTADYTFFDPHDQDYWGAAASAFSGENVELMSSSGDHKHMVLRVDGPRTGSAYFVVDLTKATAAKFADAYAGIGPADIAEVKRVSYNAGDGFRIPAYLTLPKGRDPKNLPLVVLPHGGPASRDTPAFDWWSQAIAAQGYAVLQPEFRGSAGFGWAHLSAGFGQWGRKMQSDLSDGVTFLAGQGIVDPKRVCIVGGSYGGYAALAGATIDKGIYRCAVSVAGIGNLRDMLASEDRHTSGGEDAYVLRYWKRFMGAESTSDRRLDEISPALHITDATPPVLLIHGKDDSVVPIAQSEDMESALQRAGKAVTFVKLEGEDHWLSRPQTRLQMLQATVTFLKANNPPD